MLSKGSITVAYVRGVPIRVHWSTPLGAVVFLRSLNPIVWIAYFVVIALHELGHATFIRRCGHHVEAIEINGLGGVCQGAGDLTRWEDGFIAWGGVVAQAALLVATWIVTAIVDPPSLLQGVAWVFTSVNLWMILFNLLPIPPLDGARAWPFLVLLAADRGWIRKTYIAARSRPRAAWSRSAEWMESLRKDREGREAERQRKAREAAEKETQDLDESDNNEAPPIPDEVGKVIDRAVDKGRSSAKKGPPGRS